MLEAVNRSVFAQDEDESDSEASRRDLVDQNGSDDESFVDDEGGSDNASDHGLEPPRRRRRRATPPPVPVPPPAGSMDLGAQNARHGVRRLQI